MQLAEALQLLHRATWVNIRRNKIGKRGYDALAAAIARGDAPRLALLSFEDNMHSQNLQIACRERKITTRHPFHMVNTFNSCPVCRKRVELGVIPPVGRVLASVSFLQSYSFLIPLVLMCKSREADKVHKAEARSRPVAVRPAIDV